MIQLSFLNSLITPIKNTVHSRQLCSGTASWKVGGSNKELVKDVWRGFTGGDLLLLDGLNFELDMDTQFETSI